MSIKILVPFEITSAMLITGTTIPEPDPYVNETAWVSGGTYVVDDLKTYEGVVWSCVKDHTGRITNPKDEIEGYWLAQGPSNKMAPFDDYAVTTTKALGSLTYVISGVFPNGISLWNMEGDTYSIVVRRVDETGEIIAQKSGDLYAQALGFYELMFSPLPKVKFINLKNIPLAEIAHITITITGAPTAVVSIGTIKIGDWRTFVSAGDWGEVEYGASSKKYSNTYREYNKDGTLKKIIKRPSRKDIKGTIRVNTEEVNYADALLDEITDVAVVVEMTDVPEHSHLNVLGFLEAEMFAEDYSQTRIELNVKGNI